jgi:hypothetical protein
MVLDTKLSLIPYIALENEGFEFVRKNHSIMFEKM